MHHRLRIGVGLLSLALVVSGCFGPFNLTRRVYTWNSQVGDMWEKEIVFLLLALTPVYSFATLADAIVFNSMEFWTGNNPVDPPRTSQAPQSRTKRIVRGDDEAILTYTVTPERSQLLIEQFHRGAPAGSLRIERRDGVAVGFDAEGNLLLTARSLSDGGILVQGAQGRQVASYSVDQIDRFATSRP